MELRSRARQLVDSPVRVVAEVSANHGGSLESARLLVREIAKTGATHVKFQTYTADTMTIDCDEPAFRIGDDHELWAGRTLYGLYQEAHTPWEWHEDLFNLSRELGLTPFSSPFDRTAVEFLESLDVALYKIASLEVGDIPLIECVASTGKPMIISTGAATLPEVDQAVAAAREGGCQDLTLLLCTSSYPASPEDVHLRRLDMLRNRYSLPVGISDHTLGIGVSVAAVALGAEVVERHVTLDRAAGGPDSAFSLEPQELLQLVTECRAAYSALGNHEWNRIEAEAESMRLKRSLYVVAAVEAGEEFSQRNVRCIRPSGGLPPKYLSSVLGRRANRSIPRGAPLTAELIEGGLAIEIEST
jgi:pseudaminic acid synthase